MVYISDIWSIFEATVLHRLHGELPEAGELHGGVVVPVGSRRGAGWTAIRDGIFQYSYVPMQILLKVNEK